MDIRPSWDEYFMDIADKVGERATCGRGRSGAIIVKDKKILTTGYVGSPPGFPHCDDISHVIHTVTDENGNKSEHCVNTLHAEENAILQAAEFGICIKESTIYCKIVPCFRCAMKIIRVGIIRVVAKYRYQTDHKTIEMFKKAKVILNVINDEVIKYERQNVENKEQTD